MSKQFIGILAVLVAISSGFFLLSAEKNQNIILLAKEEPKRIEKTIQINQYNTIKESSHKKSNVVKQSPVKKIKVEDRKVYLAQGRDNKTGQYTIRLFSEKELLIPPSTKSQFYIPFNGTLESDTGMSEFSISLSEEYIPYLEYISFELTDQVNKSKKECKADFVGELEKDIIYNIKFNYLSDELSCFILDKKRMSNTMLALKKKMSKPMSLKDLPEAVQKKYKDRLKKNN